MSRPDPNCQSERAPFVRSRDPNYVPGRNAEQIRAQATRVIRGRIPAQVRKELMTAVKAGYLGRLMKDGLKPEIFFDPSHYHGAVERQTKEALYAVSCIATVVASPADVRAGIEAAGGDVLVYTLAERVASRTTIVKGDRFRMPSGSEWKVIGTRPGGVVELFNKAECRFSDRYHYEVIQWERVP